MKSFKEIEKEAKSCKNKARKKALEILLALAEIYEAEKFIEIDSVQISGVSYKNIGDAGLEFLRNLSKEDAKVVVKEATLNPCGIDLELWKSLGIPEKFAKKQIEILNCFKRMGIKATCSCVPYLIGNKPKKFQSIAWSESSAVCFANSVLAARTNRESGISALCSGLTGITPLYGYHLEVNRMPTHLIKVECPLKGVSDFSALGYFIAKKISRGVPYFSGIKASNFDELKALSAALATSGSVAMFHVHDLTPEAKTRELRDHCKKTLKVKSLRKAYKELNSRVKRIDLVAIGCPHLSINEIKEISLLLKGEKLETRLWLFTSRKIKERAGKYIRVIEKSGAKVLADTCIVVMPIEYLNIKTIATNSGKAAFYLPSYAKVKVRFGSLESCINAAINGIWKDET